MSVINQMLKDLEQRQQPESAGDNQPSQGLYQEQKANKTSRVLILLLVLILFALGFIGWQMFSQKQIVNSIQVETATAEQLTTKATPREAEGIPAPGVNSSEQIEPGPIAELKKQEAEPKETELKAEAEPEQTNLAEPRQAKQGSAKTNQANANEAELAATIAENSQAQNPLVSSGLAQYQAVELVGSVEAERPSSTQADEPEPRFVIEKSNTQMTLAQRVTKLLTEAKSSFDKGYITEAIEKLEQVIRFEDGHIEARNLLAGAWYGRGELNSAIKVLNDGLQRYPSIEEWRLTAAKIFFKENNTAGALSYLDIELNNASKEFYTMKGSLARQLRQFAKAELAYIKLTQIEPHIGNWWLGLAIAQDSLGKQREAIASYKSVLARGGVSQDSAKFARQRIAQIEGQS